LNTPPEQNPTPLSVETWYKLYCVQYFEAVGMIQSFAFGTENTPLKQHPTSVDAAVEASTAD